MENTNTRDFLTRVQAIELTDYLRRLNILPAGENAFQVFYPSPFSRDNFYYLKVNKQSNEFYDSFAERRGNLLDFGMAYHQCSLPEFLSIINQLYPDLNQMAVTPDSSPDHNPAELRLDKVLEEITNPVLLAHLKELRIPAETANRYCRQLDFTYYGERLTGIGFPNSEGGFAILHPRARLHTDPLSISVMSGTSGKADLYQDFTDFLNVAKLRDSVLKENNTVVILHDLSRFEPSRQLLEQHTQVNLHLHNTPQGKMYAGYAQWLDNKRYIDFNRSYQNYPSITAMHMETARTERERITNSKKP